MVSNMTQNHHRIYTFDLLRGIAVLAMMLAHSVYFFHNRQNDFLVSIEGFGNIISFVLFLLVSGAVSFFAYSRDHRAGGTGPRRRMFSRILLFLLAYYILALVLVGADFLRSEGLARVRLVLDILSFRILPGFTEYFPPFIFYGLLLASLPRLFHRASRSIMTVAVVSLAAYLAGFFLYQLPVGSVLRPWVALLAGAEGLYRFPLLQYLPVFLLGLYWGQRTITEQGLPAKRILVSALAWFFFFLVAAAFLASYFLGVPLATTFSRWPPSLPFLALGLGFSFFAARLLYALHQLRRLTVFRDLLLVFGQNALGFFWSHIFLLGLYATAGGDKVSSLVLFFFLWLLLMVLSLALTTFLPFNFRLALTSIRGSHEEHERSLEQEAVWRLSKDAAAETAVATKGLRNFFFPDPASTSRRKLKKRHKLGISLVALSIGALVFPVTTQEIALKQQRRDADVWWGDVYTYRQPVTLKNTQPFVTLESGTPVAVHFDHATVVAEGKSTADGNDVALVYWSGHEHIVTASSMVNPDSTQATLKFRLPAKIKGGDQDQFYYLYYGGFVDTAVPVVTMDTATDISANFGPEETYPLVAGVSKNWNLIGQEDSDHVDFHLDTPSRNESQTATYQVLDTDITGPMTPSADTSWEAVIPVAALPPGAYRIQATLRDGQQVRKSQQMGFYRSYPLYAAWTVDWEGYDANPAYLDAMAAIADQFHLPMTHFFNPRIYVTETIKTARSQSLTNWVKRRLELGDGLGLHLHLFLDFVEQAGIAPRTAPNWGDNGSGYGVPLGAYTRDEQRRLIQNAADLMVAFGFRRPDVFRAGGWYANLDTLAALEDLGFKADSSARTSYSFGKNKLPGYWNILDTTQPYYPSRRDQNRPATTNALDVLEIPDNGADSYSFNAQAMIDRFSANLGDGILKEKRQITFLSHPHWFDDKEQARVRELFSFVSRYDASQDRGPVIFTTTEAIVNLWTHGQ